MAEPAPALREAESYLLDLELFGMRLGVDRMWRLTTALGLPQRRFASIHVVGSNGKSSTARMTAAVLARHGLRTGLYTSPHLRSFTERVEVDGDPISGDELAEALFEVRSAAEAVDRAAGDPEDRVTQFEALTAAGMVALARRRVEVAVVEAGLGGRLDATNVIAAKVVALTTVALEHTRWLGDTLEEIAREKLAVLTLSSTLVTGELDPEAAAVAEEVAGERQAALVRTSAADVDGVDEGPPGPFQRANLALARAAARAFLGRLDESAFRAATAEVRTPGRLETVGSDPLEIHDGAHNPAGAHALAAALPSVTEGRELTTVVGVLDDKDLPGVLGPLLEVSSHVVLTPFAHPRARSAGALAAAAAELGGGDRTEEAADPAAAVARARELAGPDGAVLVTGSLYLLSDLLAESEAARLSTL